MQEKLLLAGHPWRPGADSGGEGKSKFSLRHFFAACLDFPSPRLYLPLGLRGCLQGILSTSYQAIVVTLLNIYLTCL